jgi:hypothetical protein
MPPIKKSLATLERAQRGRSDRSLRCASDLPGHADSKVALHLFDRPGRPSSEEGQTDSRVDYRTAGDAVQ